ncbi:hypothetical protein WR25_19391 isoform V [Diploscapter pachys]|uniref:Potassium channel domain-containing protein n=2 Tax=Diploscapter pachys TaxID=2018661 RepID=A0A2A2K973_9BILA|nr:hypothetical protein WR25_19391 isoform D [Diploscapter pachys]PAV70492.1 hypothetical protein WR25_19391 isoform Q [Diploscapter pachys]PAV70494.1 hypothetical protein WR25_19391 isoform S [Diploscapter pachys]PAV70497.1 hypothetical protein WR25_19391 isoform V [Diploscapter pachys]
MNRKSSWLQTVRNSVLGPNESHLSLISVARNIQHTGSQIKQKRADLVYLFLLIIYTFAGAFMFKYFDGEYDERMIEAYNTRCNSAHRNEALRAIQMNYCNENNGIKCFKKMRSYLEEIENCYIRWHEVNKSPSYSMNDFVNSLVYSFSVYTTIGWGNIAADTTACRIATVLYAIIGIPLFFAFAKEAGLYFRPIFINLFNKFEKWCNRKCCKNGSAMSIEDEENDEARNFKKKRAKERASELYSDGPQLRVPEFEDRIIPKLQRQSSSLSMSGEDQLEERRRVFTAGVAVLIAYFLVNSLVLKMTTEFDFITSVYFSFTSVATIGFPSKSMFLKNSNLRFWR